MTTKEASRCFRMDAKEVRKRFRDGMIIDAYKDGNYIIVPDETEVIPSKQEIKSFLLQIIKLKNNDAYVISRGLCPDITTLKILIRYLYKRGIIGNYDESLPAAELLASIQLTDTGFAYMFGQSTYVTLNQSITIPVNINICSAVF